MRKLIAYIDTNLDGVVDMDDDMVQRWHFPFFNDELATYAHQQLFAADALLLGRRAMTASPRSGRRRPTRKASPTA